MHVVIAAENAKTLDAVRDLVANARLPFKVTFGQLDPNGWFIPYASVARVTNNEEQGELPNSGLQLASAGNV